MSQNEKNQTVTDNSENIKSDVENGKNEVRKQFDLDDILKTEVGQFGKYQVTTILLAAVPIIFSVFAGAEYVFTTARIPTRCRILQCDSDSPEFAPNWILNAVPGTSVSSFADCERYSNSSIPENSGLEICPAFLFDQSVTEECDSYVYENSNTVVYDFDLGCDEWRRSQIGSIRTIGTLLALPVTGYISDRWGRRVALSINAFNTGWIGLVRSFVNTYEGFLTLEVVEAILGSGGFSTCFILVTELVGPKYRVAAGAVVMTVASCGHMTLGLIAWGVQNWRTLTQVLYAPQLLTVCYFWILSESVRWLLGKGRYEESADILKKAAQMNGKKLSEKSIELLKASAEAAKTAETPAKEEWLIIQVFRSKAILLRCIIAPIWWITITLVYHGMNINAVNLSGNRYLNYVYVAAIDIPGYWTSILLLERIGRKPVLIIFYFLCAACQFGFVLTPSDYQAISLTLYLFGKYAIACVINSTYVYTAEIFPTKYRHSLFAFTSMVGRLGSITAPLTPSLALTVWEHFPSTMFGCFAVLSGFLIFLAPETRGTMLPDTMEEAEGIGAKKTPTTEL